jgi:hypothetical protein
MEWLCALTDGDAVLSTPAVETYHAEIHATFPKLLGAMATVSSLNERVFQDLLVLADQIFVIDSEIAAALRGFPLSAPAASAKVARQRAAATTMYKTLPISISRIMRDMRQ